MKIQTTWREIDNSEQDLKTQEGSYAAAPGTETGHKLVCIGVKKESSLNFGD